MAEITIWIPRPPDNANSRQHWRKALRAKRDYWAELNARLAVKSIPPPPELPPEHAWLNHLWYCGGRKWPLDADNAVRRLKPVVDWLVAHRYLRGDTIQHLSLGGYQMVREFPPADAPPLASVRLIIQSSRSIP